MTDVLQRPEITSFVKLEDVSSKLLRATEAASIAVLPLLGKEKNLIDEAAVVAITRVLHYDPKFTSFIAVGEGVKDDAPHLVHGASYGSGEPWSIAADPVEGTTFASRNLGPVLSIIAATRMSNQRDHMPGFRIWNGVHRITSAVVGSGESTEFLNSLTDFNDPYRLFCGLAEATGKNPSDLRIAMLDRPERNGAFLAAARRIGAEAILYEHGDFAPAFSACMPAEEREVDIRIGSGGTPEAILAALVARITGGGFLGKWCITDEKMNDDLAGILNAETMHASNLTGTQDASIVVTAITDHPQLKLTGAKTNEQGVTLPGQSLILSGGNGGLHSMMMRTAA